MSLKEKESKLTDKQVDAVKAGFDVDKIKDIYLVDDDETAEMIAEELKNNNNVKEYSYTLAQVKAVETELYLNATLNDPEGKSTVKQKAIDSFLDRVKGKAQNNVDVTSGGKVIGNVISFIDGEQS